MAYLPTSVYLTRLLNAVKINQAAGPYAGPLYNMKVALFTNQPALGWQATWADIVEATFGGYVRQVVAWAPAYTDPAGQAAVTDTGLLTFTVSAITNLPQIITGYALVDDSATPIILLGGGIFATPFNLQNVGDVVKFLFQYEAGPGDYGEATLLTT